jgi:hypothetical protein
MRRWLPYILLALVACSFAAVVVQLSAPTIHLEWERQQPAHGELIVALDNSTLLVSDHNYDHVRAYSLSGEQLWEFRPPHPPGMVASINVDANSCYVSTNSNWLYALDKHGKLKWQRELANETNTWGYAVAIDDKVVRASLASGEFYSFDNSGNSLESGMAEPRQFSHRFYLDKRNRYIGPGAKSVIDGQGQMWVAEPILKRQAQSIFEKLKALIVPSSLAYNNTSTLTVKDEQGNVTATTTLPFGHTSNAIAMPDGTVVFIGGLGRMVCYSLTP